MHRRLLAGLLLVAAGNHSADAATYSYMASGTLSNSGGLGPPPFPNGTSISIQFSIDSATPDSNTADNSTGRYSGLSGTFTLGGQTFSIDSYGYRYVEVSDNNSYYFGQGDWLWLNVITDNFSSLDTPEYNGSRIHHLSVLMQGNNTGVFSGDSLSNSIGHDLQLSGGFNLQAGNLVYYNSDAIGPVTAFSSSIVPVPATVWLLGSALGVLGWIRRKAGIPA